MSKNLLATSASLILLAIGGYYFVVRERGDPHPMEMQPDGESTDRGIIVETRTVDWVAVLRSALTRKAAFLTMTLSQDKVRDEEIRVRVRHTPITSGARVRVKYHVEYPIGYHLNPGQFMVSGDSDKIVLTLAKPQLVAKPSVRLLSYRILDTGYLVDEKTALLKLQQRIQPQEEKNGPKVAGGQGVVTGSEDVLRRFLTPILTRQANGGAPPAIEFRYR